MKPSDPLLLADGNLHRWMYPVGKVDGGGYFACHRRTWCSFLSLLLLALSSNLEWSLAPWCFLSTVNSSVVEQLSFAGQCRRFRSKTYFFLKPFQIFQTFHRLCWKLEAATASLCGRGCCNKEFTKFIFWFAFDIHFCLHLNAMG